MQKYIKEYSVIAMLMLYVCAFAQPVFQPLGNNRVGRTVRTIYVDTATDLLYGGTAIYS